MRSPNSRPATGLETEPVARITLPASSSRSPTLTLASEVSAPAPSTSSISFFLNSEPTPPTSVLITLARRLATPAKSTSRPLTEIPNSPAWSISDSTSATRSTALAGMQA